MYFITQFSVSWLVREARGQGFGVSALSFLLHMHGAPQERRNCAMGTSLFIFTIFLESFGERGKTGMFMKVSRWSRLQLPPPSAFLFSTWAMKD